MISMRIYYRLRNQDQHAENPHPRLPTGTCRSEVDAENTTADPWPTAHHVRGKPQPHDSVAISQERRDHNGSIGVLHDAQQNPAESSLRSQATGGNAREACEGCGNPVGEGKRPDARYCSARCKNAATKRRSRLALKASMIARHPPMPEPRPRRRHGSAPHQALARHRPGWRGHDCQARYARHACQDREHLSPVQVPRSRWGPDRIAAWRRLVPRQALHR